MTLRFTLDAHIWLVVKTIDKEGLQIQATHRMIYQ
jgi:hypothetical protein